MGRGSGPFEKSRWLTFIFLAAWALMSLGKVFGADVFNMPWLFIPQAVSTYYVTSYTDEFGGAAFGCFQLVSLMWLASAMWIFFAPNNADGGRTQSYAPYLVTHAFFNALAINVVFQLVCSTDDDMADINLAVTWLVTVLVTIIFVVIEVIHIQRRPAAYDSCATIGAFALVVALTIIGYWLSLASIKLSDNDIGHPSIVFLMYFVAVISPLNVTFGVFVNDRWKIWEAKLRKPIDGLMKALRLVMTFITVFVVVYIVDDTLYASESQSGLNPDLKLKLEGVVAPFFGGDGE